MALWWLFFSSLRRFGGAAAARRARCGLLLLRRLWGLRALSASPAGRRGSRAGREAADPPEARRALVRRAAGLGAAPRQFRLERVEALGRERLHESNADRSRPIGAGAGGAGAALHCAPISKLLLAPPRSPAKPRSAASSRSRLGVWHRRWFWGDALGFRRVGVEAVGPCLFFQESFCCVVGHASAALRWLRCVRLPKWPESELH